MGVSRKNTIIFLLITFLGLTFLGLKNFNAQTKEINLLTKKQFINFDTLVLDTNSINPRTLQVYDKNNNLIDKSFYSIDATSSKIIFNKKFNDTLTFKYHKFFIDLNKNYYIHSEIINRQKDQIFNPIYNNTKIEDFDFFEKNQLNKTGSISRGLMVGNNQNFSLNSNLNLQLSGNINSDIKILASVTDDNIPIQPQGNTQQLQDFDQIFIQLFSDYWKLTTGDFWVKNENGYFLKYNKRGQGIHFEKTIQNKSGHIIKTENSVSLSKGKFSRNVIQGTEGNQGPYRLNGSENESYIIILSGTENVYIDGNLLKRGQNYDYIIDYNTAEIIFTANQLITKDKRIVVEFQYSDKNYARSLMQNSTSIVKGNNTFFINAYAEQDSKNQPLQQNVDLEDRLLMENIGDKIELAVNSGVDSSSFNENQNMYEKKDSLGYLIYCFSNNESKAIYKLTFSDVGQGNGNYIIKEYNALGKVFQWVAPDTINSSIILNGNFSPLKKLTTPKKRQLVNIGGKSMWKNKEISYELSSSNMDLNTFSQKDKQDNVGFAGLLKLTVNNQIKNKWNLKQKYNMEMISRDFNRIERFRAVEFERNWNIQNLNQDNQIASSAMVELNHDNNGKISYQLNSFLMNNEFNGNKNDLSLNWNKIIFIDFNGSVLTTNGSMKSNFTRHKTNLYIPINKVKFGFKDINENNLFFTNDTIDERSYRFYDWKIYLANMDSSKNIFEIYYQERYDWFKNNNVLNKATGAKSPGVKINLIQNTKFKLNYNLAYRSLEIKDSSLTNIDPENSLTSRLNYQLKFFKGGIYTSSFMELSSGLELQKEFIYIEVASGQGIYTWNDYNSNGIKELSEFEIAIFSDQANYIKVFTPNNNYMKVYNFQLNQNINIDPKKIFNQKKLLGKVLKHFYNQLAVNTQKKTDFLVLKTLISPIVDKDDPIIQQMSNNLRNSVFFNRSSSKYSLEYAIRIFANKNLLINGTDFQSIKKEQIRFRWNLNKLLMFQSENSQGIKINNSTYAISRNYKIFEIETINKFSIQPNTLFRVSLDGRYAEKRNAIELGNETSYISELGIEIRKSSKEKALVNLNINYVKIDYKGESNSSIGFEMLEGLRDGNNITWKLSFQKNMSNNVQLSINYSGRKSELSRAIHTGGMQLRAFF